MIETSIVIPTHNRKELLIKVLNALSNQSHPRNKYEVIVVDDGSIDRTKNYIKNFIKKSKIKIKYFRQENRGPGSARNLGISKAKGEYIILIDDDIVPSYNFIEEHIKIHKKRKGIAVLGFTDWAKDINVTEFMKFIAPNGPLFHYNSIKNPYNCSYTSFYTSNISLNKKWFDLERFNEDFDKLTWMEDVELGYRLYKRGLRIVFNKNALAYHYHIFNEKDFFNKARLVGKVNVAFYNKYPELKSMFRLKLVTYIMFLLLIPARFFGSILNSLGDRRRYWIIKFMKAHYDGVLEGLMLNNN